MPGYSPPSALFFVLCSLVLSDVTDDRLVYESRGLVYQDQGKHRRAVSDFTKAIGLDVSVGENYYHRGESLLRLGQVNFWNKDFIFFLDDD